MLAAFSYCLIKILIVRAALSLLLIRNLNKLCNYTLCDDFLKILTRKGNRDYIMLLNNRVIYNSVELTRDFLLYSPSHSNYYVIRKSLKALSVKHKAFISRSRITASSGVLKELRVHILCADVIKVNAFMAYLCTSCSDNSLMQTY